MLEILWSLAGAIHLITHIVPNSKLAKWANKASLLLRTNLINCATVG